jgi:hypothetical protein
VPLPASSRFMTAFTLANNVTFATGSLDIMNVYNRQIGIFGAAEIFVKPWVPSGYIFTFNPAQRKPLALRNRPGVPTGLQLVADNEPTRSAPKSLKGRWVCAVQERPTAQLC